MKRYFIYISLALFFPKEHLLGQCLVNGDFALACSQTVASPDPCETFNYPCVANWMRSHGTPQIKFPGPTVVQNLVYMWARKGNGEGVFAGYNFAFNNKYKIRIKLNGNTSANGVLRVLAANNMVQGSINHCGKFPPFVASSELIAQITPNGSWQEVLITYSPNSNYSQLWIYPETSSGTQLNMYVDFVNVCPDDCEGIITYTGEIPAGTTKAGTFNLQTNAYAQPYATTELIAAHDIFIRPNFDSYHIQDEYWSGEFRARIVPCGDFIETRPDSTNVNVSQFPIETVSDGELEQKAQNASLVPSEMNEGGLLKIYPNPAYNKLNIDFYTAGKGPIKVKLINSFGAVMREITVSPNSGGQTHVGLDIAKFPSGSYLVQIVDSTGKALVKKIQKFK